MKSIATVTTTVLLAISMAGCGKKAEETPVEATPAEAPATAEAPAPTPEAAPTAPGKEVLPGSASVRAALARKDYDTAVGGLLALRGAATRPPQSEEYVALYDEVKFALLDASQTDRKAAAALMTLRAAASGR